MKVRDSKNIQCSVKAGLAAHHVEDIRQRVCQNLVAAYQSTDGRHYCILHYPSGKTQEFDSEIRKKLDAKKYDFRAVFFPSDADFSEQFFDGKASFWSAVFLGKADFSDATFKFEAEFDHAIFRKSTRFHTTKFLQGARFHFAKFHEDAVFRKATFGESVGFVDVEFSKRVSFSEVTFENVASFQGAVFIGEADFEFGRFKGLATFLGTRFEKDSRIYFRRASFDNEVDFQTSIFEGYVFFEGGRIKDLDNEDDGPIFTSVFEGRDSWLNLRIAHIVNHNRVFFNAARLQPNWFVNQKSIGAVNFIDCLWRQSDGTKITTQSEIDELTERYVLNPHSVLSETCLQFADAYEESRGMDEASMFRKLAYEARRLRTYRGYKFWTLHWWYWLTSYYGESWIRALSVLVIVLLVFTVIYTQSDFQTCPKNEPITFSLSQCRSSAEDCRCTIGGLTPKEAISHSLTSAIFQNVDYRRPLSFAAELAVILEKILVPIQAALLVLAIRRRYMR